MANNPLRHLPSVNELLERPELKQLVDTVSHNVVVTEVRSFLENLRAEVQQRAADINIPAPAEMADKIAKWIAKDQTPRLRPVINATGILLHTGLGRSPLAPQALAAIHEVAGGYASVEVDIESGERTQRALAVEKLLKELTGAEAALVVNNNAGATLLSLAAIAKDKEVIVSRGQLVEIGGSYRLPDVMSTSGAILREVGTTNKTRINDYEAAIGEQTGALMRVHTSNYIIAGFSEEARLSELVRLGRSYNLPVIDDIGSGAMIDFQRYGLPGEPLAKDSIDAGADVVLFSGDKLLGGPQCGILVGRKALIQAITKHPLTRALRVDKITLAALHATLQLYRSTEAAEESIPLLKLLSTSVENLRNRAERLAPQMAALEWIESAEVVDSVAYLGGGSVPTQQIPTVCVALTPRQISANTLSHRLRTGTPSVFGRIQQDKLLIDLRSVMPKQDLDLINALSNVKAADEKNEED